MDLISPVSIITRQSFGLRLRPRPLTWISKERCRSWAPWPGPQGVVAGPLYGPSALFGAVNQGNAGWWWGWNSWGGPSRWTWRKNVWSPSPEALVIWMRFCACS